VVTTSFLSRLSQFADWAELTWNDWVIGYDFAHQTALAQTMQMRSRNWRQLAAQWFDSKQQHFKNLLSLWQLQHKGLGLLLPLLLFLVPVTLRYGRLRTWLAELRMFFELRGKNSGAARMLMASRLYQEMLQLMGRHGYQRAETQTAFEFAEVVRKPGLNAPVREFAELYVEARFGGTSGDLSRLEELLLTIRKELRAR
jgi:hypothetical protein